MTRPFEGFLARAARDAEKAGMEEDPYCLGALAQEASKRIRAVLGHVGNRGHCSACHAEIWWVRHLNGKTAPYTAEGLNHFADCPHADQFRMPRVRTPENVCQCGNPLGSSLLMCEQCIAEQQKAQ